MQAPPALASGRASAEGDQPGLQALEGGAGELGVFGAAEYSFVAVDRAAVLTDIRLEHKAGGRRGDWDRELS